LPAGRPYPREGAFKYFILINPSAEADGNAIEASCYDFI